MATAVHGKRARLSWNSVVMCADKFSLSADVGEAETTNSCDAEGAFLQGKPRYKVDSSGAADFASSGGDATHFAGLTGGAAAIALRPTQSSAGATNPEYQASAFVTSYKLDFGDDAIRYSAAYRITGAVTRATS